MFSTIKKPNQSEEFERYVHGKEFADIFKKIARNRQKCQKKSDDFQRSNTGRIEKKIQRSK